MCLPRRYNLPTIGHPRLVCFRGINPTIIIIIIITVSIIWFGILTLLYVVSVAAAWAFLGLEQGTNSIPAPPLPF